MKKIIIVAIAVVVLGVGAYLLLGSGSGQDSDTTTTTPASSQAAQQPSSDQTANPITPVGSDGTSQVNITANDTTATPQSVTVKKGAKVAITFNVSTRGTYHGGLEFKNTELGLDSGSIPEGQSGKLTFTADKSFQLTPYWYQSGVKKDYMVSVNVVH